MRQRHIQPEVKPSSPQVADDPKLKELADKADKIVKKDKFLSANKLKLSDDQRAALIKTLEMLEGNQLYHSTYSTGSAPANGKYPFNMSHWGGHCGTVCCIGGTAQWVLGKHVDMSTFCGEPLDALFFPNHLKLPDWSHLTPEVAAIALRTYLETGKEDWRGALKKSKEVK